MQGTYLDELMNVATHQLVGRYGAQTFQLVKSNNVVGPPHGGGNVIPDIKVHMILSLVTTSGFLGTRSDLLEGNSKRGCLGVRSNKSGCHCLNDLLRHLGKLLADAGQGLVLPSSQFGIHFLIKFSCHLCKEQYKQDVSTRLKKREQVG